MTTRIEFPCKTPDRVANIEDMQTLLVWRCREMCTVASQPEKFWAT